VIGYCPNCGDPVEHDGDEAACRPCSITWSGPGAAASLKPEPYAPGELAELQARHAAILEP
jgi:hypothetical protein